MLTILLAIAVLMLLGVLPAWPHSRGWGYAPSGGLGLVVLVLVVLLFSRRLVRLGPEDTAAALADRYRKEAASYREDATTHRRMLENYKKRVATPVDAATRGAVRLVGEGRGGQPANSVLRARQVGAAIRARAQPAVLAAIPTQSLRVPTSESGILAALPLAQMLPLCQARATTAPREGEDR